MTSSNFNPDFSSNNLANDLEDTKIEDAEYGSPENSDDERDFLAIETARSYSEGSKYSLNPVTAPIPKDGIDPKSLVFGYTTEDMSNEKLFNLIAMLHKPLNVAKVGKLFNVRFDSPEEMGRFALHKYNYGKVVSVGRYLVYYYRVTYTADGIKVDHVERIILAFEDAVKIIPISVTINVEKKCVSVYVATAEEFAFLLSDPSANDIKVQANGAFAPGFWLHISKCTATTNDVDIQKMQISNIPSGLEEQDLLALIRKSLSPIISPKRVLGIALYRYPDSGKPSHFGFTHVKGLEAAALLEKVEIPIVGIKSPIYFQKAIERPAERVDAGEQRGTKRQRTE